MNSLSFIIPGRAVALMRPRINMRAMSRFKGAGRGGGPLVYTPYKCKKWQKLVQTIVKPQIKRIPLFPAYVAVAATFFLKRPGKLSKFALRPDIDNYAKNLLDALDALVYVDDAFVVRLTANKEYVATREEERTSVTISPIVA